MPTREYKLRLPREVPEATSENVAQWIEQGLTNKGKLAVDPGGGPVRISISLDPEKAVQFANGAREKVHIALRRLIATHVPIEPLADPEEKGSAAADAKEHLPERVLPRKLAYEASDFIDFVRGGDKALAFIYRRAYGVPDLKAAETPVEDQKLCASLAEVVNRRSPRILLENADLVKLAMTSLRWSMAQTEQLDALVLREKAKKGNRGAQPSIIEVEPTAAEAAASPTPATQAASVAPSSPAAKLAIAAEEMAHLDAPVQQEGEF